MLRPPWPPWLIIIPFIPSHVHHHSQHLPWAIWRKIHLWNEIIYHVFNDAVNEDVLKKGRARFFRQQVSLDLLFGTRLGNTLHWRYIFEHLQAKNVDCFEREKGRARIVRQQVGSARGPVAHNKQCGLCFPSLWVQDHDHTGWLFSTGLPVQH